MAKNQKREDLLSSWKEIAVYLDCDVRTCGRWEKKHGLPVYRIDDSPKSRIYAYKEEIDRWLEARFNNKENPKTFLLHGTRVRIALFFAIPTLIIIALTIFISFMRQPIPSEPADFQIDRSELIILNKEGKEIWRYDTELSNLASEDYYRNRFQYKHRLKARQVTVYPFMIFSDINQDHHKEILFSTHNQDELGSGELLCFDHEGNMLWRFQSGRELKFGDKIYSNDYMIDGIFPLDLEDDGNLEILLIANQRPYFPTQLIILDQKGIVKGEYWNSGRLQEFSMADLDADGKEELIAGGMNNEYDKACLVVFDPSNMQGSSPQKMPYYTCKELAQGTEKYYVLFPGTDLCEAYDHIESLTTIMVLDNQRLSVMNHRCFLFFELDFNMKIQDVRTSDDFEVLHKNAVSEGKITSELNQEYLDNIGRGLQYYDGENWVSDPTINRNWQKLAKK
jgi:hypothetical protein